MDLLFNVMRCLGSPGIERVFVLMNLWFENGVSHHREFHVTSSATTEISQFCLAKTFTSTVADLYALTFVAAFCRGGLSRYHQGMVMFHGQVARRRFQSRRHFAAQAGLCLFQKGHFFGISYATETQGIVAK